MNCKITGCQKQLFGVELDGDEVKTAGNVWHALLAPVRVDDIFGIVPNKCPDPGVCGGPDSCPQCAECRAKAQALHAEFALEIKSLGFQMFEYAVVSQNN